MSAKQNLQKTLDAEASDLQQKTHNIEVAYQAFAKTVPKSADWAKVSKDKVDKINSELTNLRMMIDASTGELTNYEQNVGAMADLHAVAKKSQEREALLSQYQQKGVELQQEIQKLGKLIHIASNQIDLQVGQISKDKEQVQNYEEDRQTYWENLGGYSALRYEQAERFAQAVLKNAEQLIPAQESSLSHYSG